MIADDLVIARIPLFSTVMTFDGWNLPWEGCVRRQLDILSSFTKTLTKSQDKDLLHGGALTFSQYITEHIYTKNKLQAWRTAEAVRLTVYFISGLFLSISSPLMKYFAFMQCLPGVCLVCANMQGSDCAGVLVLAPARQGIPWTYVEEGRNPPMQGSTQNFPFFSVQHAVHILFSQNCTQHKNNIWDSPFNAQIVTYCANACG